MGMKASLIVRFMVFIWVTHPSPLPACVSVAIVHLQVDRLLTSAVHMCVNILPVLRNFTKTSELTGTAGGGGNQLKQFVVMLDSVGLIFFILF